MDRNYNKKKLGDICVSDLGKTLNQSKDKGELYPYLCAINVLWDKIDLSTLKQTKFEEDELDRYSVIKGDLLICEGGDIGRAAIWDKDETILYQNALHRVRFNDEVLPRFCLLYLKHLKNNGILDSRYGKGVTIKHLVKSSLLSIPIPVPSVEEQSRIVEELDLLSNIIEKKRQQLSELDNLAQSIFYDMFGDPVTNEKGWEVKAMKEVALQKPYKGDVPSINGKYWLLNLDMIVPNTGEIIDKCYFEKEEIGNSTIAFDRTNVLYSKLRPYLNKVVIPNDIGYATTELVPLCPLVNVLNREFLAHLLRSYSFVSYINDKVAGAKMPRVSMDILRAFPVILPPFSLQQLFAQKIEAIEKQKALIKQSIAETEELFNSRMDYYFS